MKNFLWSLLKQFFFRMDAERVHRTVVSFLSLGRKLGGTPLRILSGIDEKQRSRVSCQAFGMTFLSPVGLAAGFDKDAEIVDAIPDLGFGFAEIGTVTPRPQPGNARPRLFRDPAKETLFNSMGFNGLGCAVISRRLAEVRPRLPMNFRVGVNLGKNKDTPLEDAARDYVRAAQPFEGLADYLVINVSSPNTPGLRSLQSVEALRPIVEGVSQLISGWKVHTPLLLKLAPEITGADMAELMPVVESWGIGGWILTNTLGGQWRTRRAKETISGGLSGAPLMLPARESLRQARSLSRLPIISVGGIMSAGEALERFRLGANLIQIYSGWIFRGPAFASEITRSLAEERTKNPGIFG